MHSQRHHKQAVVAPVVWKTLVWEIWNHNAKIQLHRAV